MHAHTPLLAGCVAWHAWLSRIDDGPGAPPWGRPPSVWLVGEMDGGGDDRNATTQDAGHGRARAWARWGRSDAAVSAVRCDPYASSSPWGEVGGGLALVLVGNWTWCGRGTTDPGRCTVSCILLARVLCAGKWPCDHRRCVSCFMLKMRSSRSRPAAVSKGVNGGAQQLLLRLSQVCKERISLAAPGVDVAPKPSIQSSYRRSTPRPKSALLTPSESPGCIAPAPELVVAHPVPGSQ